MADIFLEEYSADAALLKYRAATAGHGISYLLDHDYGAIYREVLQRQVPETARRNGLRVLEFGCGAGMNLIHVAAMIDRLRLPLERAYGTDFSQRLVEAARRDAATTLKPGTREKIRFEVARNEAIIDDLAAAVGTPPSSLVGSFHMVFGVNTFRYCYRMDKENESAKQFHDLLDRGGVCVMIDMNAQFRFFRSQLKRKEQVQDKQFYIPVLEDYVRPFKAAGFRILEARNFSWMPHSAGPALSAICRMLAPSLNLLVPRYALRSLVIAKKPE
jgi:SAM-dependent methyltransferase